MDFKLRQVEQWELRRRDLHCLAFVPFDYTAHQVAKNSAKHWFIMAIAFLAFAAILTVGWSPVLAVAALVFTPAAAYIYCRMFDWLVIQRSQPDYANFEPVWRLPHRVYVAENSLTGDLIGIICLQHKSEDECDLQHAAVRSTIRRQGLGVRLIEHTIAEAVKLGYRRATLYTTTVQQPAIELYKKLGFGVDKIDWVGPSRRIPFLPKPFAFVHMSKRLLTPK